jgi:hypothetical protein
MFHDRFPRQSSSKPLTLHCLSPFCATDGLPVGTQENRGNRRESSNKNQIYDGHWTKVNKCPVV